MPLMNTMEVRSFSLFTTITKKRRNFYINLEHVFMSQKAIK